MSKILPWKFQSFDHWVTFGPEGTMTQAFLSEGSILGEILRAVLEQEF